MILCTISILQMRCLLDCLLRLSKDDLKATLSLCYIARGEVWGPVWVHPSRAYSRACALLTGACLRPSGLLNWLIFILRIFSDRYTDLSHCPNLVAICIFGVFVQASTRGSLAYGIFCQCCVVVRTTPHTARFHRYIGMDHCSSWSSHGYLMRSLQGTYS